MATVRAVSEWLFRPHYCFIILVFIPVLEKLNDDEISLRITSLIDVNLRDVYSLIDVAALFVLVPYSMHTMISKSPGKRQMNCWESAKLTWSNCSFLPRCELIWKNKLTTCKLSLVCSKMVSMSILTKMQRPCSLYLHRHHASKHSFPFRFAAFSP